MARTGGSRRATAPSRRLRGRLRGRDLPRLDQDRHAISVPLTLVTRGLSRSPADTPAPQVRPHSSPDRTDSQANSAGSIPVTRSSLKVQVRGFAVSPCLASRGHQIPFGPLASGDQGAGRSAFVVAAFSVQAPSRTEPYHRGRTGPRRRSQAGHLTDVGYESCTAPCS
jgi:hypothetical protein